MKSNDADKVQRLSAGLTMKMITCWVEIVLSDSLEYLRARHWWNPMAWTLIRRVRVAFTAAQRYDNPEEAAHKIESARRASVDVIGIGPGFYWAKGLIESFIAQYQVCFETVEDNGKPDAALASRLIAMAGNLDNVPVRYRWCKLRSQEAIAKAEELLTSSLHHLQ
jgi:hypothetical protein